MFVAATFVIVATSLVAYDPKGLRLWWRLGQDVAVLDQQNAVLSAQVDALYNAPKEPTLPGIFLSQFKRGYRWTRGEKERPLIARLTLHAEKLRFENLTGEKVELIAPLPKDFRATLNQLKNHGRR